MAQPKEVTSVQVSDDIKFEPTGGVTPVRIVTFFVGKNGPFRIEMERNRFSPEVVNREMETTVRHLREIGAELPS
jgi:hypothetical protein